MTEQVEPWVHRERGWPPESMAHSETMLALSNGYLGVRGTLDEGEPAAVRGTYLGGFYETRPISYAERGVEDPDVDQVLVDVTDGTPITLMIGDDPLDIRTGTLVAHERTLDMRAGMLVRTLRWRSPGGGEVRLRTRRLVSLRHRELVAIEYEVEPTERPLELTVISELDAQPAQRGESRDPRAGAALPPDTLVARLADGDEDRAVLVHETRRSRNVLAAGMENLVATSTPGESRRHVAHAFARWSFATRAAPGQPVRVVKFLAYHWAEAGEPVALAADVRRSLDHARALGFDGLAALQEAALAEVWSRADIELQGDPEIQHALRYALFQLHQNAACAGGRAIPAKGLTGPGYSGHTFWDTEIFLLPVLTYCAPHHAANALRWRASTLPQARAKAGRLGLRGAAFPWRTIAGEECSGYLPAGTAAFHVNAAVAHAAARHAAVSGDERFERETAAPLLVEIARMWTSVGYHDERRGGRFSIDGVTGPDEYSPLVDNNLYTNLMAQTNLRAAADVADRLGAPALGVDPGEAEAWRRAADAMTIPYDDELDIHAQDEDFSRHAPFDFDSVPPEHYPLLLHVPYFELYRRQVVKQPDLVLAMALCPSAFTADERRRNFAYYEALTVRDSSLSAGTQAVVAADVGDIELAYDYLAEAVLLDHHDIARNTADGLHLAALAGGWIAVIAGLAGTREENGELCFAPRLPSALDRIAFTLTFRDRDLRVELSPGLATYRLTSGPPVRIWHWAKEVTLEPDAATTRRIPPARSVPDLRQPPSRSPRRRRPSHAA